MVEQQYLQTNTNVNMPKLIYGTAWKKERTAQLVMKAIKAGFKGIDTACQPKHYNEPMVGEALQRLKDQGINREELFVQTKFTPLPGHDPQQIPYDKNAPIELQLKQSFEVSKTNLQTNYVDSFVLHSPVSPHESLMKLWKAMEAVYDKGEAHQLGISNCYDLGVLKQFYNDARIKPAVIQNRFYQQTGYDVALRSWCSGHGIIYQSFWTLTANPHILADHIVCGVADKYYKTEAQILFRYLTQTGNVVLTGTCSEQHMKEDVGIFDFELSVDDIRNINHLFH